MQSGLARIGAAGLIAGLLIPLIVVIGVRTGARTYCARAERKRMAQTATPAQASNMEAALLQTRTAVHSVRASTMRDFSGTEEFGRWLHEAGKQQHLVLQNLTLNKDPAANPHTPAFTASFHTEQPFSQLLLLLDSLQNSPHLVLYDTIRLRLENQGQPPVYVADVTLHTYSLTALKPKIEP